MPLNIDGAAVVRGPHVQQYGWEKQKQEHHDLIAHMWGDDCQQREDCERSHFCPGCHAWHIFDQYWGLMEETFSYEDPPPKSPSEP